MRTVNTDTETEQRMRRRRAVVLAVLCCVSAALGWWLGPNASFAEQRALMGSIVDVAAIIFAILGLWVAMLNPSTLLSDDVPSEPSPRTRLAFELVPMLILATGDLAGVLLLLGAGLFLPREQQASSCMQRIHAAIMIFLALVELYVLTGTLLPIARVQRKHRRDALVREGTMR
ncbi:MAG: hypothetical protein JST22_12290 [Bacteroidetes bacterium]|nr:hypothetical protein [Bacteroidota bacterium]